VLPRWVIYHELVLTTKEYMRQASFTHLKHTIQILLPSTRPSLGNWNMFWVIAEIWNTNCR
jgi:hypothetical protein